MSAIIKITSLSKYEDGLTCLIGLTEKGELEVFYANRHIIENMLLGPGDTVKIEYTAGANKPKEIEKITEWRIGNMKDQLIKIIDECIAEQQRRIRELNAFLEKYELSESGIENAREKASAELQKYIAGKVAEINQLFEKKIKQLDDEEQNDIEKKNNSLAFQQIMHEKASVLKLLDCSKIKGDVLADYLKEFENYPVAVELFRNCCTDKENYLSIVGFLPEDNRGKRQDRMRETQINVAECLEGLSKIDVRESNVQLAMVESCKNYIKHQAEDFSISSEEVWGEMGSSKALAVKNQ